MKKILVLFILFTSFFPTSNLLSQAVEPEQTPSILNKEKANHTPSSESKAWMDRFLARSSFTLLFGENGGQHIFESGTKFPNLSGIKAGSRITYNREFEYGGIEFKHWWEKWELAIGYRSNGQYNRTGEGRDEDFFLGSVSQERGSKIDFRTLSFYDTPYTFTGSQNFADGRGKLKMKQDRISLSVRKYFGSASPDSRKEGDGFFLSGGFHYTYFKYFLYDVNQWIATTPVTYGNIGIGLSYSNSTWEIPAGFGYRFSNGIWILEASFFGNVWYSHFRDYHYQRNLNFIGDTSGYGVETNLGAGYIFQSWLFFLKFTENRLYGSGSFFTKGGLNQEDIASNYSGNYRNYLSTKQFSVELQVTNFLDWVSTK